MTDVRARGDLGPAFDEKTPTLDRRQLIRAGAWAAPVIVLATAAPAAAAQSNTGNVPASALSVDAYNLSNLNAGGTAGPLSWAGGHVGYWNAVGEVAVATFTWTAVLVNPNNESTTVASGGSNVAAKSRLTIPSMEVATKPLLPGEYKLTLTIFGSGTTSNSDQSILAIT